MLLAVDVCPLRRVEFSATRNCGIASGRVVSFGDGWQSNLFKSINEVLSLRPGV